MKIQSAAYGLTPSDEMNTATPIQVVVWGKFRHGKQKPKVAAIHPEGMHETIAAFLRRSGDMDVTTAWLDQVEHGLNAGLLDKTEALVWWGHLAHGEVKDELVKTI